MKWLTLEQIKRNSRIDGDYEDTLLVSYGESAEDTVLNYLNRPYQELIETWGKVPEPVVQASLMLVDVWYQHRAPAEPVSMSLVPYTFEILIKPYMRLASAEDEGIVTYVPIGNDTKAEFTADLPDDLKLSDVEFTGIMINADTDKTVAFTKSDCIMVGDGASYVVLIDTDVMGVGQLLIKLTVQIPDTDYQTGYRRAVIKINPHIQITG